MTIVICCLGFIRAVVFDLNSERRYSAFERESIVLVEGIGGKIPEEATSNFLTAIEDCGNSRAVGAFRSIIAVDENGQ